MPGPYYHYRAYFQEQLDRLRDFKKLVESDESDDYVTELAYESAHNYIRRECKDIWETACRMIEHGLVEEEIKDKIRAQCEAIGELKL